MSDNYDWNTIYPKTLTDSNMVLCGEYRMDYTADEKSETYEIKKSEEEVALLIAAFYNDEGAFLGRVLVSEDSIICFDKENKEKSRIEGNNFLSTFLYATLN